MKTNQLEILIEAAGKKLGTSPDSVRKMLENGDAAQLVKSLPKQDRERLRAILSSEETTKKLRSAQTADEIRKIIGK